MPPDSAEAGRYRNRLLFSTGSTCSDDLPVYRSSIHKLMPVNNFYCCVWRQICQIQLIKDHRLIRPGIPDDTLTIHHRHTVGKISFHTVNRAYRCPCTIQPDIIHDPAARPQKHKVIASQLDQIRIGGCSSCSPIIGIPMDGRFRFPLGQGCHKYVSASTVSIFSVIGSCCQIAGIGGRKTSQGCPCIIVSQFTGETKQIDLCKGRIITIHTDFSGDRIKSEALQDQASVISISMIHRDKIRAFNQWNGVKGMTDISYRCRTQNLHRIHVTFESHIALMAVKHLPSHTGNQKSAILGKRNSRCVEWFFRRSIVRVGSPVAAVDSGLACRNVSPSQQRPIRRIFLQPIDNLPIILLCIILTGQQEIGIIRIIKPAK